MSCEDIQSTYVNTHFKLAKKKKFKRKLFFLFLLIFFIVFLIFLYFNKVANPIIFSYAKSQVDNLISQASNKTISNNISSIDYNKLITITYSSTNEVSSITANSEIINELGNNLANQTQNEINNLSSLGIKIPIGTFSGIPFLIGKGGNISISLNPIGSVIYRFYTSFTSAGINQTSHKIYLSLESQTSLNLPFKMEIINKKVDFLISECLIVGKVPSFYVNITSLEDLYK